jgi:uncharacterized protein YbdZ (MbtH family)
MNQDEQEDRTIYKVVLNHEEQYSIWPAERENPAGWRDDGKIGLKQECLAYIDEVWTDMRPLSLRQQMAEDARRINETVYPFTQEPHPVTIDWSPEATVADIKDGIEHGFIPIAFVEAPDLPGVGIMIDHEATDLSGANWATAQGSIRLEGQGTIYAVGKVRVVADINLSTRTGRGQISILEPATP